MLSTLNKGPRVDDYSYVWERILSDADIFPNIIPSAFTDWDNTPRRGTKGSVMKGSSPEKFKDYLIRLIKKTQQQYKTNMMFLFAWNEWAEGGYLEPDNLNGYGYLEAVLEALTETDEYPY